MKRWNIVQTIVSVAATAFAIWSLYLAKEGFGVVLSSLKPNDPLYQTKIQQVVVLTCWIVLPPVWFWFEYFFLYTPAVGPTKPPIDEYKHGVDVASKIWLALVTA